jgi:hypothetical protein
MDIDFARFEIVAFVYLDKIVVDQKPPPLASARGPLTSTRIILQ